MGKNKVLFVDATIRKNSESRTYQLCRAYLDQLQEEAKDCEIINVKLWDCMLLPIGRLDVELRKRLVITGNEKHELLDYALEFASADMIVIGAPYWDLSFPSVLKVYLEKVCVPDITFRYTPSGVQGLCRAKQCVYITTSGGAIGKCDFGTDYVRGLCESLLGIEAVDSIRAELLDVEGVDEEAVMRKAFEEAREKASEAAGMFRRR